MTEAFQNRTRRSRSFCGGRAGIFSQASSRPHVQRPHHAKAVAGDYIHFIAIAGSLGEGWAAPAAASHHALGAVAFQPGRAVGRGILGVTLVVAILGPFFRVAIDLVETERVWQIAVDRFGTR